MYFTLLYIKGAGIMRIRFKNEFFKNRIMSIIFKFVLIPFIIISLILAFFIIRYNKMKIVNRYDALLNNRIKELDSLYQSMFDKIVYIKTNTRIKRMLTSDYGYNFADELSELAKVPVVCTAVMSETAEKLSGVKNIYPIRQITKRMY